MKSEPFNGRCRLGDYSSLRKRMRAARRGFFEVIEPNEKALMRHAWYRRKKAWDLVRAWVNPPWVNPQQAVKVG